MSLSAEPKDRRPTDKIVKQKVIYARNVCPQKDFFLFFLQTLQQGILGHSIFVVISLLFFFCTFFTKEINLGMHARPRFIE